MPPENPFPPPPLQRVSLLTADTEAGATDIGTFATRDHDAIRRWAQSRQAEPATGEATSSGPAGVDVHDGGSGIRFNFPALSRFRPITWDEWFDHFDLHGLIFVYAQRPDDTGPPNARYHIMKAEELVTE